MSDREDYMRRQEQDHDLLRMRDPAKSVHAPKPAPRPYPELLTPEEDKALLETAERVWRELQANNLGGFSGANRPFWILHEFKTVIEKYGHRDVGLHWTKNQLDAAKGRADG